MPSYGTKILAKGLYLAWNVPLPVKIDLSRGLSRFIRLVRKIVYKVRRPRNVSFDDRRNATHSAKAAPLPFFFLVYKVSCSFCIIQPTRGILCVSLFLIQKCSSAVNGQNVPFCRSGRLRAVALRRPPFVKTGNSQACSTRK